VLYPSGAIKPEVYLRADITKGCRPRNVYLTHARCLTALDGWIAVRLRRRWGLSGADEYRQAFTKWHADASASVSLGLESFESNDSFAEAVKKNFGIAPVFITAVNNEIPANWTMPGRPDGTTRNSASMGSLFGGASGGGTSQSSVKPVGRLG